MKVLNISGHRLDLRYTRGRLLLRWMHRYDEQQDRNRDDKIEREREEESGNPIVWLPSTTSFPPASSFLSL